MKKICFLFFFLLFFLTGCTDSFEDRLDDVYYAYPENKDVVVNLEMYNKLSTGLSENDVWNIFGGQCTNTGTTDLGIGSQYVTVSYGCNGNGSVGSNVQLIFQGGKLKSKSQIGLK